MIQKTDQKESNLVINIVSNKDYVLLCNDYEISEDEFYVISSDISSSMFNRGTDTLFTFVDSAYVDQKLNSSLSNILCADYGA